MRTGTVAWTAAAVAAFLLLPTGAALAGERAQTPVRTSAGVGQEAGSGQAGRAVARVKVTLPVKVFPTVIAVDGAEQPSYPERVTVRVPRAYKGRVAAYGGAGLIFIAPTRWKAKYVRQGTDGSRGVVLRSSAAATVQGSLTYSDTGAASGADPLFAAAPYFPWVRKHWDSLGGIGPVPKARSGLHIHFIGQRLISYTVKRKTDAPEMRGVAHTGLMPGERTWPLFDHLETKLSRQNRGISTVMLDCYVARYHKEP